MANDSARLVFTGASGSDGEIAEFVGSHGDGVRDIALVVRSAEAAFQWALAHGARGVQEPSVYQIGNRTLKRATVAAVGDVFHSFVERDPGEWFLPGLVARAETSTIETYGITAIDHLALAVPEGALWQQVEFYTKALGFRETHHQHVVTPNTAMNSTVVESWDGGIKLTIVEAAPGRRESQVQEFVEFNRGPGVQHLALSSDNIVATVGSLRGRGLEFLPTPATYYEMLPTRIRALELQEDLHVLRELGVLVDRDPWGYLLQIFSQPVQARPTFFTEIIQRRGARGFGAGNIKALFEALEKEQFTRTTTYHAETTVGGTPPKVLERSNSKDTDA